MYEMQTQVRYSECDEHGRMALPALVNAFQDCAVANAIAIHRGPDVWIRNQKSWMIIAWKILIHEYPALNDKITVSTWAYDFHGAEGDRNFIIRDEKGNIFAKADSLWVYFDLEKGRPARVPAEESDGYGTDAPYPMEHVMRHIRLPEDGFAEKRKVKIRRTQIDSNGHVNNEEYIVLGLAHVKSKNTIKELRVQYIRQAKLGDVLTPIVRRTEEETYTYFLLGGELCAITHFLHPSGG